MAHLRLDTGVCVCVCGWVGGCGYLYQGFRRDQKIKRSRGGRWSWTFQVSPEEIMSREVELGCESWTSFASSCSSTAVQRTLSLWLCPARQLKQQLRSALVVGQWRGDTALTLRLFWRRSTVSPVFFGRYPRSSLHSFVPFPPPPPLSPSLISHLTSVDVKQNVPTIYIYQLLKQVV